MQQWQWQQWDQPRKVAAGINSHREELNTAVNTSRCLHVFLFNLSLDHRNSKHGPWFRNSEIGFHSEQNPLTNNKIRQA